ncbi:MAG: phage tail protein, partial [bacterium]|nr:phage tail protein [bacterium]
HVEVDGLLFAGFNEVSGLSVEIVTEEYNEGGINDFVHILPKTVKYQNIVLKQGILHSSQMWGWIQDVKEGKIEKRNGRIILLDGSRLSKWYWNFTDAYPIKWSGTDFKATGNDIFVETLELSHCGIEKSRSPEY